MKFRSCASIFILQVSVYKYPEEVSLSSGMYEENHYADCDLSEYNKCVSVGSSVLDVLTPLEVESLSGLAVLETRSDRVRRDRSWICSDVGQRSG